jgi:hypothetical protein
MKPLPREDIAATGAQIVARLTVLAIAFLSTLGATQAQACTARALPPATVGSQWGIHAEGRLTQAWLCKDNSGEHVVTASQQAATDKQLGTELIFVKFSRQGSGWKKDWQARDYRPDSLVRQGTPELLVLKDADSDGELDVFIAYTLPGPGAATDEGKLLVYYKDHKYAIRGAVARTPEDFGSRKLSPNFLALPQSVQTEALRLWDKLSAPDTALRVIPRAAAPH